MSVLQSLASEYSLLWGSTKVPFGCPGQVDFIKMLFSHALIKVLLFCRTGVFSLTPGYGLQFILNCKKPGFHPHPKEPPLYEVRLN